MEASKLHFGNPASFSGTWGFRWSTTMKIKNIAKSIDAIADLLDNFDYLAVTFHKCTNLPSLAIKHGMCWIPQWVPRPIKRHIMFMFIILYIIQPERAYIYIIYISIDIVVYLRGDDRAIGSFTIESCFFVLLHCIC